MNATVIGGHEIPHRVAMRIPVTVPQATVGCDIYLEGPIHIKRLVVESTLNTVREGHKTALVVNTTGGPIKLKTVVLLTKALVFDRPVVPEPLEFPASFLASVYQNTSVNKTASVLTLKSCVLVADYPEPRHSLLELLNQYRDVIALPQTVWGKIIYALESGDETYQFLFHNFFLSQDGVLSRYWPHKTDPVAQCVITETYIPMLLRLVHDEVIAVHPGKERILSTARRKYYWPTMRVDIDAYIDKYVKCAQHKVNLPKPAPILEYSPPEQSEDVVAMDLLQLPPGHQGSKYLLVCVNHFSRYVVLVPVKEKIADAIAHALITNLICPYSTPRVILRFKIVSKIHEITSNGTEVKR